MVAFLSIMLPFRQRIRRRMERVEVVVEMSTYA